MALKHAHVRYIYFCTHDKLSIVFLGRSVGRQLRCHSCKAILVTKDLGNAAECENIVAVKEPRTKKLKSTVVKPNEILESVTRGGLSYPSEVSFAICALGFIYFNQLNDDEKLTRLLIADNHCHTFIQNVEELLKDDPSFNCMLNVKCGDGHSIFRPLMRTFFNCCAQNLRKNMFSCDSKDLIPPGEKGSNSSQTRKLRKLTSKSSVQK